MRYLMVKYFLLTTGESHYGEHKKKAQRLCQRHRFYPCGGGLCRRAREFASFPYKTSANGGAAFVFVYILSVIVIGSIVMLAEMYLGKRAQANPVSAYKKAHKNLGWLGLFAIIIPLFIICYYAILGGYTVKFTLNSFEKNSEILNSFAGNVGEVILYTAIFLILSLVVVMAGVKGGIEKASKVLMPALFLILVAIVIYCLCLGEGVSDGLNYYLNPDFGALGFNGILAAMS